ncbi:glycosyltransferase family 4 protein [Photobacterium carnosum]|uniref:glycosyltransferase family 4 protein n=1 Tax=Photobacterium carnosum TaxID=2023717 RepID=UPI001E2A4651|nr:glycosyltransferase family 4 protein [Photobacterium carnosum]MCD9497742.1 glycosyltransferase [Photobacterium carnosum]
MKVCFVTDEYAHDDFPNTGGIGIFLKNLSVALSKDDIEVYVLGFNKKNKKYKYKNLTIETFNLGWIEYVDILIKKIQNRKNLDWITKCLCQIYLRAIASKVKKHAIKYNIDIIEFNDYMGFSSFVEKSERYKIIIRLHGSKTVLDRIYKRRVNKAIEYFEQKAILNADLIIAVSEFAKKEALTSFDINSKIEVCYNGVNNEE